MVVCDEAGNGAGFRHEGSSRHCVPFIVTLLENF
jgi:hypothetical protein